MIICGILCTHFSLSRNYQLKEKQSMQHAGKCNCEIIWLVFWDSAIQILLFWRPCYSSQLQSDISCVSPISDQVFTFLFWNWLLCWRWGYFDLLTCRPIMKKRRAQAMGTCFRLSTITHPTSCPTRLMRTNIELEEEAQKERKK